MLSIRHLYTHPITRTSHPVVSPVPRKARKAQEKLANDFKTAKEAQARAEFCFHVPEKWVMNGIFSGDIPLHRPYIDLIYGIGTSNLGSWNGHWVMGCWWFKGWIEPQAIMVMSIQYSREYFMGYITISELKGWWSIHVRDAKLLYIPSGYD